MCYLYQIVRAIITIFKAEFVGKQQINSLLMDMCTQVKDVEDASIYSPKSGRLFEFLNILRDNKIAYGTHFNTALTFDEDN
jgi:hypothetical protein